LHHPSRIVLAALVCLVLSFTFTRYFLSVLHIVRIIIIVVLKRQNRLKVGTDKPKLKVKMQLVSDDDVRKRLLEQPRFELAAKGVFRVQTGKMLNLLAGLSSTATDG